eukprot:snap_masked-scaffold_3-processed-gene-0.39-mRNA-1 protein AED:1.00 eAED:1.00 QI:0/0/0/0/1/1/2/0/157
MTRYKLRGKDLISHKCDRSYDPKRDDLKGLAENTKSGYEAKEQIINVLIKQLQLSMEMGIINEKQKKELVELFDSNDEIFATKSSVTQLHSFLPLDICLKVEHDLFYTNMFDLVLKQQIYSSRSFRTCIKFACWSTQTIPLQHQGPSWTQKVKIAYD